MLAVPLALALLSAAPVRLAVHVAEAGGAPLCDQVRAEAMAARAGELHAQAYAVVELLPLQAGEVLTPADRDALAKALGPPDGRLHVFVVPALADKDVPGVWLAGVHWRAAGRHYVIVSARDASPDTLAHELGHYFGLGHATAPDNLMTQAPARTGSPVRLTPAQLQAIARGLAAARRRGELTVGPCLIGPRAGGATCGADLKALEKALLGALRRCPPEGLGGVQSPKVEAEFDAAGAGTSLRVTYPEDASVEFQRCAAGLARGLSLPGQRIGLPVRVELKLGHLFEWSEPDEAAPP